MHATKQHFMGSKARMQTAVNGNILCLPVCLVVPAFGSGDPLRSSLCAKCATVNATSQTTDMTIIGHSNGQATRPCQASRTVQQTEHFGLWEDDKSKKALAQHAEDSP